MGTTQPANRGRALILGVLHAMAVPTEPKSGTGIVETIRRTVVIADMTFYIIISAKHHYLTRVGAPRIEGRNSGEFEGRKSQGRDGEAALVATINMTQARLFCMTDNTVQAKRFE